MEIKTKQICPFGMTACERIVDNEIHRCNLYLEFESKNTITDEVVKTSNCSFNWGVILQHEANKRVLGVQEATESFRNEMVKTNENSMGLLALMVNKNEHSKGQEKHKTLEYLETDIK